MFKKYFNWLLEPFQSKQSTATAFDQPEAVGKIIEAIGSLRKEKIPIISSDIKSKSIYRPITFNTYIGQEKAKTLLKSYIEGTLKRNKVFPHLLIHGPAGCGKTTLAKILASELKVNFRQVISSTIDDSNIIIDLAEEVDGGIVFLDEIHGLERESCEPLYTLMEDFTVYDNTEVKPFTLIGATTEIGEILKNRRPFYDRFKIKIELEDYTKQEMKKIIKLYKEETFKDEILNPKIYDTIATNCRLTPRKAISLLETTIYLGGDVEKSLYSNNIILGGYTDKDLKVLEYLKLNNGSLGVEAISSYLNTSKENYVYDIEPWLLRNNLIVRTSRGRKLTEEGYKILTKLKRKIKGE